MPDISNMDDLIDSRDVIARIEELEAIKAEYMEQDGADNVTWESAYPDTDDELRALKALADEAEGYAADWRYGEPLIRDSYFQEYAEQLADDLGAIPSGVSWPLTCIDWTRAARELQMDYTAVDFDGVTYWIR